MLVARDKGVKTCNLRRVRSMITCAVTRSGFIPDEGEIFSDEGVGRVNGWGLSHLRFVLGVP